ncbi:MAG: FAD:protein FMN transferase, partial [Bacteroidales bacterium]|nr:FAD:protein FMN transferase [Bacteroidales bacterium]
MKKSIYIIIAIVALLAIAIGRKNATAEPQWTKLQGSVFHTFYHITYEGAADYSYEIDSLFRAFDGSLSMFNDTSIITRMNRNDTMVVANAYVRTVF